MQNPLIPAILSLLREQTAGISEYELMQALAEHESVSKAAKEGQLALFQKHFMIMNALYEIQHQLWQDEQLYLEISALQIQILTSSKNKQASEIALSETAKLSDYYRDWENFENTTEEQVIGLLADFWKYFTSLDKRESAYKVLELEPDAARDEIVRSYRRLAASHHPDKGGDQEMFIRIRQAYEILKISP